MVAVRVKKATTIYYGPSCQFFNFTEGEVVQGDVAAYLLVNLPDGVVDVSPKGERRDPVVPVARGEGMVRNPNAEDGNEPFGDDLAAIVDPLPKRDWDNDGAPEERSKVPGDVDQDGAPEFAPGEPGDAPWGVDDPDGDGYGKGVGDEQPDPLVPLPAQGHEFNPSEHSGPQVIAFAREHPEMAARIRQLESQGKCRTTVLAALPEK